MGTGPQTAGNRRCSVRIWNCFVKPIPRTNSPPPLPVPDGLPNSSPKAQNTEDELKSGRNGAFDPNFTASRSASWRAYKVRPGRFGLLSMRLTELPKRS